MAVAPEEEENFVVTVRSAVCHHLKANLWRSVIVVNPSWRRLRRITMTSYNISLGVLYYVNR